ncbi:hypothetical protein HDU97_007074 [Phlyctochytrium planicorne]|nr:hypothetical protein HDU97_007074 [Phlyctochytrium planicorne]
MASSLNHRRLIFILAIAVACILGQVHAVPIAETESGDDLLAFHDIVRRNMELNNAADPGWLSGAGRGDITPPIGELNMMGYAKLGQNSRGIQTRLYARALLWSHPSDPLRRVVYISTDSATSSNVIKQLALSRLAAILPAKQKSLYTDDNVLISATHTHSGTGGYNDDFLYQVTSFGVYDGVREAIADGIVDAILDAHNQVEQQLVALTSGADKAGVDIEVAEGFLDNASINRSPKAYEQNPAEERAFYGSNVDQKFPVVTIRPRSNPDFPLGAASWFAVHGTSMDNTNELLSGDNKGVASLFWEIAEKQKRKNGGVSGTTPFVAAFGQTNAGDVSPNVQGPHCTDTGAACDGLKGSCGGDINKCVARGPGYEIGGIRLATRTIAERQFLAARSASDGSNGRPFRYKIPSPALNASVPAIDFRHAWVDMSNVNVNLPNGKTVKTCKPSMGQSFAAGTVDGTVGLATPNSTANPILTFVRDLVFTRPSDELLNCQFPKPVLLPTGEATFPYGWQPTILPLQILRIGNGLAIVGFPSEITTMSGRRVRKAVKDILVRDGLMDAENGVVAIAGLSNSYASYAATNEEYQFQAYEGACTIFGPNTVQAYIQTFSQMAASFSAPNLNVPSQPIPKKNNELATESPVVLDAPPIGKKFAQITIQPQIVSPAPATPSIVSLFNTTANALQARATLVVGKGATVMAEYVCAHPRNGATKEVGKKKLTRSPAFMTVERQREDNGQWETVLEDGVFDTMFEWRREGIAASLCRVGWVVGDTVAVPSGTYRFKGFGTSKVIIPFIGDVFTDFVATTDAFSVIS